MIHEFDNFCLWMLTRTNGRIPPRAWLAPPIGKRMDHFGALRFQEASHLWLPPASVARTG
jgi:hypothetical protein